MIKTVVKAAALAAATLMASGAFAESGHVELQEAHVDLSDRASLQRGARTFFNYCVGCHSAEYMRYSRLAKDLEIPPEIVEDNLMFTTDKIGETVKVAMQPNDAVKWFGVVPPDLSVVARSRGPDWIYSFLLSYYQDESKPTGVNNSVFVGTAMPHVLAQLQGVNRRVEHHGDGDHGHAEVTYETAIPGTMSEGQYRQTVGDLVNYLVYMGEPAKLVRGTVGRWVLSFLLILLIATYVLKKEYWRDVH